MSASSQQDPSPGEGPSVHSRILAVPKGGARVDEYEDAAVVREETWPVRAAVADGATESVFAQLWAEILVTGACSRPATPEAFIEAFPDWQATWADALADRAEQLPWYGAAKAREGAFATFLGLELRPEGRWQSVAVGDCLLVHLRDATLRRAWPYTAPDDFTNRPALLPSRSGQSGPASDDCRVATGIWQSGDTFLLATDAVGAWLLRSEQQEQRSLLTDPTAARTWTADAFRETVGAARAEGHLRNDDSTLLVLELEESPR